MDRKKTLILSGLAAAVAAIIILWLLPVGKKNKDIEPEPDEEIIELLYGIDYRDLTIEEGVIESGQTLSGLFARYGIGASTTDRVVRASDSVFNLRNMRAGNPYTAFLANDSIPDLRHFVYEHTNTEYIVISFEGDSVVVNKDFKDITIERKVGTATITSSLWNSMVDAGMPAALVMELSEIYAWTIDFFGLQQGDNFTVIYDERYVDSTRIGVGRIWGARFNHGGKDYYAIPFNQEGKVTYWDQNGNSLRMSFLKAPLKYSRISSKFSNSRLHPVLKIRRPHHGVDYAAPAGTPVHAVADGVVTFKGWDSKGGGNTLKIKHANGLSSGYLHLRGFAAGINNGTRVNQGDLIGYVGSTGTSTGPHLDFRIWKNGSAIDPLKLTAEPAEPISDENRSRYETIRERIMAELRGELPKHLRITDLDSLSVEKIQISIPDEGHSLRSNE